MKENSMTDTAPHAPLRIEIHDPRNITVYEGDQQLGSVIELKLHAAVDKIPPIFEVSVMEIVPEMSDVMKLSIKRTMEVAKRCGAQIKIRPISECEMETNPEEQTQAEQSLKEQLIPPKV
jgi:hypothetical protein